jgi:hypothetical protein
MARAVKTKPVRSLAKGQRALLLPGPTEAKPWELWAFGGKTSTTFLQTCATPLDNRLRRDTTLAFPVSQVFCVPLWLNETDPKQFGGMIPLQLELRGLQPRNEPAIFDWTVVVEEEGRTLVLVAVLPANLPPELHTEAYGTFDLSARYLPFPANALILWKENDRLAIAITRGSSLVYFQALVEGEITPRVLQDLRCAQMTLEMQDILAPLEKVVLWTEISADDLTTLRETWRLPITVADRPDPVPPKLPWKLTPAVITHAKQTQESQRWQKRIVIGVAVLYLLAALWLIGNLISTTLNVNKLRKWQAEHSAAVDQVLDGRAAWKDLAPVVDTGSYPLELLFHAAGSIPTDQLHLTLFETSPGRLLIKGEAKNVEAAFAFLAKMKADPYFSGYTLAMGNPRPLPNDLAQFQIDGTHATTN